MWKAKITKNDLINGNLHIGVELTDGDKVHKKEYTVDRRQETGWLNKQVAGEIKRLKGVEEMWSDFALGEIDPETLSESLNESYIFIKIPRTASSSIGEALRNIDGHRLAVDVRREIGESEWEKRFKFAIVRNPYTRFVSAFGKFGLETIESPSAFLKNKNRGLPSLLMANYPIFRRQTDYVVDDEGDLIVDYIGRHEELNKAWDYITDKLGLELKLPHLNKGKFGAEVLDQESRDILYQYYKEDFDRFGYDK